MPRLKNRTEQELSERIPFNAAKDWIDQVDDWSFSNRIRSRSEAIRRLVEKGLAAEKSEANANV